MVDIANLTGSVLGLSQILQAGAITASGFQAQAATIRLGGEIAAQGLFAGAAALRSELGSVDPAIEFNLGIQEINFQRKLAATSRQFSLAAGKQISSQARTGLSLTSKSFLMVQNETRSFFEQGIMNLKVDRENQISATRFQGELRKVQLENQARATEQQGQVQRVAALNRAANAEFRGEVATFGATQKVIAGIPTILSEIFN